MNAKSAGKIVYASGGNYPFSNAIRAGDFVFVSGQIAFMPDGSVSTAAILPRRPSRPYDHGRRARARRTRGD
jgi:hypothetical protein